MTTQWKMVKTGMFLHELFFYNRNHTIVFISSVTSVNIPSLITVWPRGTNVA